MRKKVSTLAVAAILAVSLQGCYGSFALTKKLPKWNGSVGNKFVNELVFLAAVILPVYSITTLVDGVILNSVEFWSGKNPIALKSIEENGQQIVMKRNGDGAKLYVFEKGQPVAHITMVTAADGSVTATSLEGLNITASTVDGVTTAKAADGTILAKSELGVVTTY